MRSLIALTAVLGLAACAPMQTATPDAGPQQCDAAGAQSLIGSHVGAVSFPAGANVRIVCTTCATTRDYRRDRLNIRFDEATGVIRAVDCG